MSSVIKLVQNDTRPYISVSLTDESTGNPIDLTGSTVAMYFRATGSTVLKDTLTGQLLVGKEEVDGSINIDPPYNVLGSGGRVQFPFNAATLDTAGNFEGEIQVTFSDAGIATTYDLLKFKIRDDLGP